jgi:hypothetical protein
VNRYLVVERPEQTTAANLDVRTAAGPSMTSEFTTSERWLNESGKDQPWNAIGYVQRRTGEGQERAESSLSGADVILPKI